MTRAFRYVLVYAVAALVLTAVPVAASAANEAEVDLEIEELQREIVANGGSWTGSIRTMP